MCLKDVCIVLFVVASYTANCHSVRMIIPDSAVNTSQYFKPATAVYKAADNIIRDGLLRKWRSESAVIEFRKNGLHSIDWYDGNKEDRSWGVNNRVMKFVIFKGEGAFGGSVDAIQYYFIIYLTDKKIECQELIPGIKAGLL